MKNANNIIMVLSGATTAASFASWGTAAGAAFDMPVVAEALVDVLAGWVDGYSALEPARAWGRLYVAVFAFLAPMPLLVGFAAVKAYLLPRNIPVREAWGMELARLHQNTWLLWTDLKGNFR